MIPRLDPPLALVTSELGPFFEPRHEALATELLADVPEAREALGGHRTSYDPHAAARALGESDARVDGLGLFRFLVPEKHGGASVGRPDDDRYVDVRSLVLVRDALAQTSPMADSIVAVQGLGSWPVSAFGTPAQRARILPDVVRGTRIGAFGLTEPLAGSDVASLQTTARREGDGWVLDGEKWLISNIGIADHVIVFATVDPALGRKGITAFLVEVDTPGLSTEPLEPASPHPLGRVTLLGCRVGDSSRRRSRARRDSAVRRMRRARVRRRGSDRRCTRHPHTETPARRCTVLRARRAGCTTPRGARTPRPLDTPRHDGRGMRSDHRCGAAGGRR
jgi:acyl-CoA dehydrogenase